MILDFPSPEGTAQQPPVSRWPRECGVLKPGVSLVVNPPLALKLGETSCVYVYRHENVSKRTLTHSSCLHL